MSDQILKKRYFETVKDYLNSNTGKTNFRSWEENNFKHSLDSKQKLWEFMVEDFLFRDKIENLYVKMGYPDALNSATGDTDWWEDSSNPLLMDILTLVSNHNPPKSSRQKSYKSIPFHSTELKEAEEEIQTLILAKIDLETEIEYLRNQLGNVNSSNESYYKEQLERSVTMNADLRRENNDLLNEKRELESKMNGLSNNLPETKTNDFKSEYEDLVKVNTKNKKSLEKYKDLLTKQTAEQNKIVSAFEEEKKDLILKYERQLSDINGRFNLYKKVNETTISELEERISTSNNSYETMMKVNGSYTTLNANLEVKNAALQDINKDLESVIEKTISEREVFRKKLHFLEDQLNSSQGLVNRGESLPGTPLSITNDNNSLTEEKSQSVNNNMTDYSVIDTFSNPSPENLYPVIQNDPKAVINPPIRKKRAIFTLPPSSLSVETTIGTNGIFSSKNIAISENRLDVIISNISKEYTDSASEKDKKELKSVLDQIPIIQSMGNDATGLVMRSIVIRILSEWAKKQHNLHANSVNELHQYWNPYQSVSY